MRDYFARKFNCDGAQTVEDEYNIAFMNHRKEKMERIKQDRDNLKQRKIAISVQSEDSGNPEDGAAGTRVTIENTFDSNNPEKKQKKLTLNE